MIELAILYRVLNLYSHHAHNLTKGPTFFEDHEFFGSLYATADDYYDQIIERFIGTESDNVDLCEIIKEAHSLLESCNDKYFDTCLVLIEEIIKHIDSISKSGKISVGTQNLIQGQADALEVIVYKLKRKMK
jgi:DNA-binding ferritin-like protein